jgi:hypothetical protein
MAEEPVGLDTETPQHYTAGEDYKDLADDVKKTVAKHKTPADTVKAYADLSKKLGSEFRLPEDLTKLNEDQKAELITKTRSLRSVPEKPEDYKIEIPEGVPQDANFIAAAKALGKELDWTQEDMQRAADFWINAQKGGTEKLNQKLEKAAKEAETKFRIKHGSDFDVVMKGIDLARDNLASDLGLTYREEGSDELRSRLDDALDRTDANGRKLGNDPAILDMLDYIYGRLYRESSPIPGAAERGDGKGGVFSKEFYDRPS